jgi:outer membrane protein
MKRTLLLIALAFTYVVQAQNPQTAVKRIGYANIEYIMSKLPDMKAIEAEMKSTQTQLQTQLQAKSEEVQKQYQDFNAAAEGMVDTVRAKRQQLIEQAMADLEKMQQDAQITLQNKQKLFMAPLYLKVNKAIEEVAKENGFEMVLSQRVSGYNFLLYQDKQLDISDLVLKKFGVDAPQKK